MQTMRRLTGVLAATALALFAAGCGGTTEQIGSGASDIVPASAPVFIAVDTDPDSNQWRMVDQLAGKFPDKEKGINRIKAELRKDPGVEWEQDLKPALGTELDVIWLDFEADGDNFVVLVQPKSEAKFKQFVQKANASESDPSNRMTYEKYKGWYLLSEKQATLDRFESESDSAVRALSDESAFKQSMDRLGGDSLVRAYVNGQAVMNVARKYGGKEIRPYLNKVGKLDWIASRLGVSSEGVALDAIVHGTPGKLFKGIPKTSGFTPKLLGDTPQNALLYFTFHGSKNMFKGLQNNTFFRDPQFRQFAQPLNQIGRILEGENAIYVRPGTARSSDVPFAIPEVTLLATPSADGTKTLDRMIKRFAGSRPQANTVDGTPVHSLASNGLGLYYANVGGKFVVTDQPGGIRGVKSPGKSLSESGEFKDTKNASGLPDKTFGFVYVNIHSSVPYGEKLAQQHIPADIARNLKPLRSAVEYVASHTHEAQITFFVRIK
jgi:hypothetical protein